MICFTTPFVVGCISCNEVLSAYIRQCTDFTGISWPTWWVLLLADYVSIIAIIVLQRTTKNINACVLFVGSEKKKVKHRMVSRVKRSSANRVMSDSASSATDKALLNVSHGNAEADSAKSGYLLTEVEELKELLDRKRCELEQRRDVTSQASIDRDIATTAALDAMTSQADNISDNSSTGIGLAKLSVNSCEAKQISETGNIR